MIESGLNDHVKDVIKQTGSGKLKKALEKVSKKENPYRITDIVRVFISSTFSY